MYGVKNEIIPNQEVWLWGLTSHVSYQVSDSTKYLDESFDLILLPLLQLLYLLQADCALVQMIHRRPAAKLLVQKLPHRLGQLHGKVAY